MRKIIVTAAVLLTTTGCSSGTAETTGSRATPSGGSSSEGSTSTSTPSSDAASGVDACDLLSEDQLADLAGEPVGKAEPVLVGSLPACHWQTNDGLKVQAGSLSASDWVQGLPQLLGIMEDSGLVKDADGKRRFQRLRDLLEPGVVMSPTEACQAFSAMLGVQGQPAGTQSIVNVFPHAENAMSMSGQMCSAGRFTTVTLTHEDGLEQPLPGERVQRALDLAHRRSLS